MCFVGELLCVGVWCVRSCLLLCVCVSVKVCICVVCLVVRIVSVYLRVCFVFFVKGICVCCVQSTCVVLCVVFVVLVLRACVYCRCLCLKTCLCLVFECIV